MSNSYECAILGLYTGIFTDIRRALPTVGGLGRDESRLLSLVRTRGLRVVTLDFPAYGKHFDKCLSEGLLTPSRITGFGYKRKGSSGHAFLRGLMMRVFGTDGVLLSQPCITSIFFLRQLLYGAKKIRIDCTEKVRERTLTRYVDQERSLRSPTLFWGGDHLDHAGCVHLRIDDDREPRDGNGEDLFGPRPISAAFCDTVHDVADRIATSLGFFNPTEWRSKHGPGAVADSTGRSFKYDFPTWSKRLEVVFPYAELAFANFGEWGDTIRHGKTASDEEVPAMVLTVPKSQKAPRIIAKEPTAAMWCQQIVRDFLEQRVMATPIMASIHFRDQTFNGNAALLSSRTGKHWTVDLSDASDRMSLWLIERLFRRNKSLLEAFNASRSTYCYVPRRDGTDLLKMKKFAPQGSATTFPLQTIVYTILAVATCLHVRGLRVTTRNIKKVSREVLVFGDDSIIPEDAGKQYVELMTYCGFSINYSKTFGIGKFRESCGVEAFDGADVTPAYIVNPFRESDPSSVASTVECSNNFYKKGLWHAASALESTLPHWVRKHLHVAGPGDGSFGLSSFVGSRPTAIKRWNAELHRDEYLSISLSAKSSRCKPGGTGHLLQYFTERPPTDSHWESGYDGRSVSKVRKRWEPMAAC